MATRCTLAGDGPLEPGTYGVRAIADEHAPSAMHAVEVGEGETSEVSINLVGGGRVAGRVMAADSDTPIPGANVRLETASSDRSLPISTGRSATSGPDGRFELAGIPPGRISVEVSKSGYRLRLVSGLQIEDGETTGPVVISLAPAADGEAAAPEYEGIGVTVTPQKDTILIMSVMEGGGAEEAGLVGMEKILAIDGILVGELDMRTATERMRGPAGTTVTLRIETQDGDVRDLEVPRRRISGD